MKRCCFAVILLMLAVFFTPAPAGILFNRKPKPNPNERVPALIVAAKNEREDGKRESAVEELGQYDPNAFPEILPVLVDVAQQDRSAGVRLEALKSLARLRPVTQQAGAALEMAESKDSNLRVRFHARTLLWQYRMSGYRSGKGEPPPVSGPVSTQEPPLAPPLPGEPVSKPVPVTQPLRLKPLAETPPPPLADPTPNASVAKPLPKGPPSDGPALTRPE